VIKDSVAKAVIVCAGGHGRVVLDILRNMSVDVVGFLDDDPSLRGRLVDDLPVLGNTSMLEEFQGSREVSFAVAIADNTQRARIFARVLGLGLRPLNTIHPHSAIAQNVRMGRGVAIMPGVVVNTGTVIGDNVCVNTGATVDHDNVLEDHSHVFPGAHLAGGVRVGRLANIGTGAIVLPYLEIGANAYVGAGAVVREDVPPNAVVAGVPAKLVRYQEAKSEGGIE